MSTQQHRWKRLQVAARQEVEATLRALPAPVQKAAGTIPVVLEARPTPQQLGKDLPPDLLGLFVGEAFPDTYAGGQDLPAQILLFLENIWEYAGHDSETYREEIRRTLLHELGHYLGLDESALADRDLD